MPSCGTADILGFREPTAGILIQFTTKSLHHATDDCICSFWCALPIFWVNLLHSCNWKVQRLLASVSLPDGYMLHSQFVGTYLLFTDVWNISIQSLIQGYSLCISLNAAWHPLCTWMLRFISHTKLFGFTVTTQLKDRWQRHWSIMMKALEWIFQTVQHEVNLDCHHPWPANDILTDCLHDFYLFLLLPSKSEQSQNHSLLLTPNLWKSATLSDNAYKHSHLCFCAKIVQIQD